jgi:hypothetical protein
VGLALGVCALLFSSRRSPPPNRGENDPPPRPTASGLAELADQAAKRESEGDYEGARGIYEKLCSLDPKSVTHKIKLAECLSAGGKKGAAGQLLREVAKEKTLPPEIASRVYTVLVDCSGPVLGTSARRQMQQVTDHLLAGEEIRKHSNDQEVRPEHRPHYRPYATAIELIQGVLKEAPGHIQAHLRLGVAHENVSNYGQAAEAYATFLGLCEWNGLPQCKETAEISKRLIVCRARDERDAALASQVPGQWYVARADELVTHARQGGDSVTRRAYQFRESFVLHKDGTGSEKTSGSSNGIDYSWRVVDGYLILSKSNKNDKSSNRWYVAGRLSPGQYRIEESDSSGNVTLYAKDT